VIHFYAPMPACDRSSFFGDHSFPIPRMIWFWNWPSKAAPIS